jgi:hypothetical protein
MVETDREQVISLLRACVMSMKGGVPVRNLNRKFWVHHQSPSLYISLKIWAFRFLSCIEYGQEMLKMWISNCSLHVLVLVQQCRNTHMTVTALLHSTSPSSVTPHILLLLLLLLLLLRCYNSVWVLVRSTIAFHESLSSTLFFQFLIFIVFWSFLTSSYHLFLGLPIGLEANGFHL